MFIFLFPHFNWIQDTLDMSCYDSHVEILEILFCMQIGNILIAKIEDFFDF